MAKTPRSKPLISPSKNRNSPQKLPIAHSLLARAHSPDTAQTIYKDSIVHRPLYLHQTGSRKDDISINARKARQIARTAKEADHRRANRRPRPLSAAQKRKLGLHEIPKAQMKWENFVGLNRLWTGYIRDVLGWTGKLTITNVEPRIVGPILAAADLHGAEVEVVRCRCVGRVGLKGIVVKDTKETLEIVTRHNELKVVPKEHTVFRLEIPLEDNTQDSTVITDDLPPAFVAFELQGSQFAHRPAERATRKLKVHLPPDI